MKVLFIFTPPGNPDQNSPIQKMLLAEGFRISAQLDWKDDQYLVTSISATKTETEANESPLSGNEIIFIEQKHSWLAISKTGTVQILKTEELAEKIKSILKNYEEAPADSL